MQERGFTLLETLIAATIFSLVMVGALQFYATSRSMFNRGQSQAEVQQNGRVALEAMAREIRVSGYDPAHTIASLATATPIQAAESSRLVFVADVTADGTLDQVTYRLLGSRVVRGISSWNGASFPAATEGEVASGVATLTFTYFDDASPNNAIGAPVASSSLDDIRKVTVALVADQSTGGMQATFPLTVDVELRN